MRATERAYIAPGKLKEALLTITSKHYLFFSFICNTLTFTFALSVNDPNYIPDIGSAQGIMYYSFKMRLPPDLYGDLVLIQW